MTVPQHKLFSIVLECESACSETLCAFHELEQQQDALPCQHVRMSCLSCAHAKIQQVNAMHMWGAREGRHLCAGL